MFISSSKLYAIRRLEKLLSLSFSIVSSNCTRQPPIVILLSFNFFFHTHRNQFSNRIFFSCSNVNIQCFVASFLSQQMIQQPMQWTNTKNNKFKRRIKNIRCTEWLWNSIYLVCIFFYRRIFRNRCVCKYQSKCNRAQPSNNNTTSTIWNLEKYAWIKKKQITYTQTHSYNNIVQQK